MPPGTLGGAPPWARKLFLAAAIAVTLAPLAISRSDAAVSALEDLLGLGHAGFLVSLGLSFFTMQIIAYLVDVYRGTVSAQRNPFKYALFVSFFPQVVQGPIPRYAELAPQLYEGHRFDEEGVTRGFLAILWGFFLKLMVADKAGVVVDTVFGNVAAYQGAYVLVGGVLYSVQLYADFLSCTTLAQGVALLFGIRLGENFDHPYLATSIKDFWRRWHISLSSWLRDYVYIPLGGNRKGRARKYLNVVITFLVSGLWHGAGATYLVWGLMHAVYQIVGELTEGLRDACLRLLGISREGQARTWIRRATTFALVMLAWIVFRAGSLSDALTMLGSLFTTWNPWIFFDDSLLELGLDWKEWVVLAASVLLLVRVSLWEERLDVRGRIMEQPFILRLALYVVAILVVMVFGTYGYGFDAADFIYGGF